MGGGGGVKILFSRPLRGTDCEDRRVSVSLVSSGGSGTGGRGTTFSCVVVSPVLPSFFGPRPLLTASSSRSPDNGGCWGCTARPRFRLTGRFRVLLAGCPVCSPPWGPPLVPPTVTMPSQPPHGSGCCGGVPVGSRQRFDHRGRRPRGTVRRGPCWVPPMIGSAQLPLGAAARRGPCRVPPMASVADACRRRRARGGGPAGFLPGRGPAGFLRGLV